LTEHLTQYQVDDYCRLQLRRAELLSVSAHLDHCEVCRRRIESAMNGDAAFFALRSEVLGEAAEASLPGSMRSHPTFEQTAGYVDGDLTGEELHFVADHLTSCEQCALAVDDLRDFKKQVGSSLEHEYHPAPVHSPTESWWQRTVAAMTSVLRTPRGLAFGAALAALLLAVTGWLIWRTLREREREIAPKQEIVETPASPSPLPLPPAPTPLIARLDDGGGRLALDEQGRLVGAEGLPAAYQNMLKAALTNPRIEASPHLKGLTRPPSSLMSTDNRGSEFLVLEPAGRVLMTDRPTFRWTPVEGAAGYVVEVYDKDFNVAAISPQLTKNSWTMDESLPRGRVYSWQVKATKDGQEIKSPQPPAPQAIFRILDQAKVNELARAKRAYASSHLAMGLLYAQAGLLNEAEQELRLLQKANPDSEIAVSLLEQVQKLRR
jgi:anti-sigma factor RsiW